MSFYIENMGKYSDEGVVYWVGPNEWASTKRHAYAFETRDEAAECAKFYRLRKVRVVKLVPKGEVA